LRLVGLGGGGGSIASIIAGIVGAVILLAIYRLFVGQGCETLVVSQDEATI
jgi:uncharacterized membrane protein YeaQ/YmgE (transglycosylase-associated protein family)